MKIEFRGQTDNGEYAYGDSIEGKYILTGHSEDGELMLCKINPDTLSLNFEDMLDSQGNKIFASLNEDGKGGDCTFMKNGYNETFMWDSLNGCILLKSPNYEAKLFRDGNTKQTTFNKYKVIGIQE